MCKEHEMNFILRDPPMKSNIFFFALEANRYWTWTCENEIDVNILSTLE